MGLQSPGTRRCLSSNSCPQQHPGEEQCQQQQAPRCSSPVPFPVARTPSLLSAQAPALPHLTLLCCGDLLVLLVAFRQLSCCSSNQGHWVTKGHTSQGRGRGKSSGLLAHPNNHTAHRPTREPGSGSAPCVPIPKAWLIRNSTSSPTLPGPADMSHRDTRAEAPHRQVQRTPAGGALLPTPNLHTWLVKATWQTLALQSRR